MARTGELDDLPQHTQVLFLLLLEVSLEETGGLWDCFEQPAIHDSYRLRQPRLNASKKFPQFSKLLWTHVTPLGSATHFLSS